MRVDMKIPTLIFFTIYKYIHCLSNDKILPYFFMQLWTVNEVETFQKFCRALLFGGEYSETCTKREKPYLDIRVKSEGGGKLVLQQPPTSASFRVCHQPE